MNQRKTPRPRVKAFASANTGSSVSFSNTLVRAAYCLLVHAQEERKEGVWRERNNHASDFAPGAIAMVVTAFEAWLNELVGASRLELTATQLEDLVEQTTVDRYKSIVKSLSGKPIPAPKDLKLLLNVRHEIIHFLPHVQLITSGNTVPNWLSELKSKKLLISSSSPGIDFHISQKLCSYALAYWACETVHSAAKELAAALKNNIQATTAENFAFYQHVIAPKGFKDYDQKFGLKLN